MIWSRCQPRTGPEALKKMGPRAQWSIVCNKTTSPIRKTSGGAACVQLPRCTSPIGDQIARLTSYIEKRNLTKKTLILFTADHGDYMTSCGVRLSNAVESAFTSMGDIMPTNVRGDRRRYSAWSAGTQSLTTAARGALPARRVPQYLLRCGPRGFIKRMTTRSQWRSRTINRAQGLG